jgi:hypothetical protein
METAAPVFLDDFGTHHSWQPTTLQQLGKTENDLEKLLAHRPSLLGLEGMRTQIHGPYAVFRQVRLTNPLNRNLRADLVMLTASGHIAVVEVKRYGNPELASRDVVGQLVDYAAALSADSENSVAALFLGGDGRSLLEIVRAHFPNCHDPEELALVILERLQRTELHLVIACDKAPLGLRDFVKAVSAQRALGCFELRVAEITPHVTPEHAGVLYVPQTPLRTEIVARTAVTVTSAVGLPPPRVAVNVTSLDAIDDARSTLEREGEIDAILEAVIRSYDQIREPNFPLRGRARRYRQIQPEDWQGAIHYEFLCWSQGVNVELHLESDEVRPVGATLLALLPKLEQIFPKITWDSNYSAGRGRLVVWTLGEESTVTANAMKLLIRETKDMVSAALSRISKSLPPLTGGGDT